MTRIERQGAEIAAAAQRRIVRRLAEAAAERGIEAEAVPDGVRLSGRRLHRRRDADPSLRWTAGWLR